MLAGGIARAGEAAGEEPVGALAPAGAEGLWPLDWPTEAPPCGPAGEAAPGEPAALAGAAPSLRTPLPRKEAAGNAGRVSTIFGMVSLIAFFGDPDVLGTQVAPPPVEGTDPAGCNPP